MYVFLARVLWAWGFIGIDELERSMVFHLLNLQKKIMISGVEC